MTDISITTADLLSGFPDLDPDSNILPNLNSQLIDHPNLHEQFSLLFLNIRSAPKNITSLEAYLHNINVNFSIIALAETWYTTDTEHLYGLQGYNSSTLSRTAKKGGGLAIYSQNCLNFKLRNDLSDINDHLESLFIEVNKSPFKSFKPLIGVIYRPPNTDPSLFIEALTSLLDTIKAENRPCYIMGDFNLNLLNCDSHPPTQQFLDTMYSHSFIPLHNQPSRITSLTATCIDNIFTNILGTNQLAGILYTDISDHLPLFAVNEAQSAHNCPSHFSFRPINNASISSFVDQLSIESWSNVLSNQDPNLAYDSFLSIFKDHYDTAFPLTTRKTRNSNNRPFKPWITPAIKKSLKHKNKLYKRFHLRPTLYNEITYRRYKKELTITLKQAEKLYYKHLLESNKHNIRKTWKIIKDVIGTPTKSSINSYFTINGKSISNKQEIADNFNSYFANVGTDLASSIPTTDLSVSSFLNGSYSHSFYLSPVDEQEIQNCINNLKPASPGPDHIMPIVIKSCASAISKPLVHLVNLSFLSGVVPDSLKLANVIPIFKAGDKDLLSNHRPISLLNCFAKIYERLMHSRLYKFLDSNCIISKHQFGFRKGFSTDMALITAIDHITEALDNKKHAIGLFLDLRKAFDTVNKEILLNKLHHYGIRGISLKWFDSYLSDRFQMVKISDTTSAKLPITIGVPQGSILGPLLFILYLNDLPNALQKVFPVIFADDTNLFISDSNLERALHTFNNELLTLQKWFIANKLSLNINKTHSMLFTSSSLARSVPLSLNIAGSPINQVSTTKFLGMYIDEKLNWSAHINYISSKLAKSIGILKKVHKILDTETLIQLYYTIVYPYFTYCHLIWAKAPMTYLSRLIGLQKKAIRIISNSQFRAHTDPLFKQLSILKLTDLFSYFCTIFIYKYNKKLLPNQFISNFRLDLSPIQHNYSTRSADNLLCNYPKCRTSLRQSTLKYQSHKLYNNFIIPLSLLNFPSLYQLKRSLKSILL